MTEKNEKQLKSV